MAISLVAPSAASALANLGAPPGLLPDAAGAGGEIAGFADLLSLQLLDLGQPPLTDTRPSFADKPDSTENVAPSTAGDPALQWLAGLSVAPVVPPTPAAATPSFSADHPNDPAQAPLTAAAQNPAAGLIAPETPTVATTEDDRKGASRFAELSGAAKITPDGTKASIASQPEHLSVPAQLAIPAQAPARPNGIASGSAGPDFSANLAAPAIDKRDDFLASLHAQVAHQTAPTATASPRADSIPTPLRDAAWAQDFSERVVWLARNDQQTAQISINPPQLGPVQIALNLNGDQATASFVSPHAEVRQAIEDALPRLREMLAGAGIDLGQANVGSQLAQQGADRQAPDTPRFADDKAILPGDSGPAATAAVSPLKSGRGLVDLFA